MLVSVPKKPAKTRISLSGFGLMMACATATVPLVVIASAPVTPLGGIYADLPPASHPRLVPRAEDDNSISITIFRNGEVAFGSEMVNPADVPRLIAECLKNGSERKVYIRADSDCPYGSVARVAEAVRSAGIENIVFLTK